VSTPSSQLPRDLIILGAAGTGLDILGWLQDGRVEGPAYRCIGFLDDDPSKGGRLIDDLPVFGAIKEAHRWPEVWFADALGSPARFHSRPDVVHSIPNERFVTLIHSRSCLARGSTLGLGSIVYPQAVLSSGVKVGSHVTILANAVINHDTQLDDYTIVASGANIAGGVKIGRCCYIGSGSQIIQNVSVGNGALVGMGSVVLHDVPPNSVVAGNPARYLRSTSPQ
jgi:sugar O-acyltransferase (sialic acid O-acetyltransferase NeuD family)